MKLLKITFMLFLLSPLLAAKDAAKAIIIRGDVKALINGKVVAIKKGQWLPQGAQVQTKGKSFAKLLFKDKSTMNIGPKSQMKIDSFPEKEAGIITLVKGTIRSKVTKNYMKIQDKKKSKLFIKTKTAAMGVRGTDFQVAFNNNNQKTSLITFEGAVAMGKLSKLKNLNQRSLEKIVSGPSAVIVRRGQFSGASPKAKKVTIPVKISPVQLETLEKNDSMGTAKKTGPTTKKVTKTFKKTGLPGIDAKDLANDSKSLDKSMGKVIGKQAVGQVDKEVKEQEVKASAPPEGAVIDGQVAPKSGGIIDLETAQYVAPAEDASYDPVAQVYTVDHSIGAVDPDTGSFKNDHYKLNSSGGWDPIESTESKNQQEGESGPRSPASKNPGNDDTNNDNNDSLKNPPPPPKDLPSEPNPEPRPPRPSPPIPPPLPTPKPGPPPSLVPLIQGGTKTKVNFNVNAE